jgi:hypothetical protein
VSLLFPAFLLFLSSSVDNFPSVSGIPDASVLPSVAGVPAIADVLLFLGGNLQRKSIKIVAVLHEVFIALITIE